MIVFTHKGWFFSQPFLSRKILWNILFIVLCIKPVPCFALELWVMNANDTGQGSLRAVILQANAKPGPHSIRFDSTNGPFAQPVTIQLARELPTIEGELIIDGYIKNRLWKPSGVTISGGKRHRVLRVGKNARVTLKSLTIANGSAQKGAGIFNAGSLVVKSVTLMNNAAQLHGGGIYHQGEQLTVINSTFFGNKAGVTGGGIAIYRGVATVTNTTFSANYAKKGGGIFNRGTLALRNSIVANSEATLDCVSVGAFDPSSTHNLIETHAGCGKPMLTSDPSLAALGHYHGPTPTLPISNGSPAVNMGSNDVAVDEKGKPLRWDQRGNGDPRFVGGFTDLGAFEHQAFPVLEVDTTDDTMLRSCTRAGVADCSLRGAMMLVNAMKKPAVITFSQAVFATPQAIVLSQPLPMLVVPLIVSAKAVGLVTLRRRDVGGGNILGSNVVLENVVVSD